MSTDQTVDTAVDLGLEAAIEGHAPVDEELRGHQWLWIMRRALGLTRTRIGLGIVILMVLIAVFGRFVVLVARLTALTLVALTIQENVEHVAAGLDAPGIGVLVSRDYPFAVGIVLAVGIAVAAVATLLTWRRAVLVARLRALSARRLARRGVASTWRPAARPPRPRPGLVARQLGRRAPPALLAA